MENTRYLALAVIGTLIGCSDSTVVHEAEAASVDSGSVLDASLGDTANRDSAQDGDADDANQTIDAGVIADAADVPGDAAYIRYERDLRPLLEASACGDCHAGVGVVMDYSWISAAGETWCTGEDYERRWNCFEEHARTQMEVDQRCRSDFYHRHGEPCFMEDTRLRVLGWAADGFRE